MSSQKDLFRDIKKSYRTMTHEYGRFYHQGLWLCTRSELSEFIEELEEAINMARTGLEQPTSTKEWEDIMRIIEGLDDLRCKALREEGKMIQREEREERLKREKRGKR